MVHRVIVILIFLQSFAVAFGQGHQCSEDLFPMRSPNKMFGFVNIFGEWRIQPIYTKVFPFNGKTAVVLKRGKYGAVNCESQVVLRLEWEEIKPFKGGVAWAKKEGKWGLATEEGEMLLQPVYDEVSEISPYTSNAYVRKGELWGIYSPREKRFIHKPQFENFQVLNNSHSLVRLNGKLGIAHHDESLFAVEPQWEKVRKVAPYLLAFKDEGKWGVARDNGEIRIEADYDSIALKHKFRFLVGKSGKYALADFYGRLLTPLIFDEIADFSGGGARVKRNNQYGFISVSGQRVIPIDYEDAGHFEHGECRAKRNGKWGVIDTENNPLIPFSFDQIFKKGAIYSAHFEEGWLIYRNGGTLMLSDTLESVLHTDPLDGLRVERNGKWSLFDAEKGKWRFAPMYNQIGARIKGLMVVHTDQGRGVVNINGKVQLKPTFDSVAFFQYGLTTFFIVSRNDLYGVYREGSQEVIPVRFKQLQMDDHAVKVYGEQGYSLYAHSGEPLTEEFYEKMIWRDEYPLAMSEKDKWGLIDDQGNELLKPTYRDLTYVGEGVWGAKEKKGWVLINSNGHTLEDDPTEFDAVGNCAERFVAVQLQDKWGFWDRQAKKMKISPAYEAVMAFDDGVCIVKKNGQWGAIDKLNNVTIPIEYHSLEEVSSQFEKH